MKTYVRFLIITLSLCLSVHFSQASINAEIDRLSDQKTALESEQIRATAPDIVRNLRDTLRNNNLSPVDRRATELLLQRYGR